MSNQRKLPIIKGKLPGPKAKAWVKRDTKVMSPSYTRVYPSVIVKAKGVWLTDVDGDKLLDFNAGIAVCTTGHCHPKVVKAIQQQSENLIHYSGTDFYYPAEIELAEKLVKISITGPDNRVFLANSGTEAVEGSIKLARYATKRQHLIAFYGAFHGRTMGALACTASKTKQRRDFSPLVPGVIHVPYAYCYRCAYNREYPGCNLECVRFIEEIVLQNTASPEEVAAFIFEPIQGEGGYIVPPDDFIRELRKLADKYGILLIDDEVQAGMGRTGEMFAIEHSGVKPDILVSAKGIASGMPLGAFIAPSKIMHWEPGAHGSTFGGNPLACAAALATIELLENELMKNAQKIGKFLLDELEEMKWRHRLMGDVRGRGLFIGVELVRDKVTKEKAIKEKEVIIQKCFEKGLLILGAGQNVIRFVPPLIITKEEATTGLEIFEEALTSVEN
ncbi:MAG: acetyl ornithine aminotransferase family protein [Candidatus Edwardsbacteria bacterium]